MNYQSLVKDLNESLKLSKNNSKLPDKIQYRVKCCSWDATIKINSVQEGIDSLIWAVKNQKTDKQHEHAFPYSSFPKNSAKLNSELLSFDNFKNSFNNFKKDAQYPIKLDVSSLKISEKVELIQRAEQIFHISDIMEGKLNSKPTNRLGNAPLLILTLEEKHVL